MTGGGAGPIDFYFDFISPYGYLASTQIERIGATHGRDVKWRPFLLGVTVMNVMGLKPVMETPLKSDYALIDRPRMAKLLGVPLVIPDLENVNSLAASRAFYWLAERDEGQAKALAQSVFHHLWVDGEDITDPAAVVALAADVGVDADAFRTALGEQRTKDLLREAVEQAIDRKVFGAPFFIVDGEPFWGVDRLWMLEHWLEHGSWDGD
jgi:2-hydroxychromene-2-carboxylate isomerase